MSNHSLTANTTEAQALDLLGAGANPTQVAAALGVSESLISQFLSQEHFSKQVAERRYHSLLKHNNRDNKLDELEDLLIKKLENIIPYMHKPHEIIHAFTKINQAKRRGSSAPESISQQQTVITLNLPMQIIQSVQVNSANQVIRAGDQQLTTVQSGRLPQLSANLALPGAQNVHSRSTRNETAPAS
jgi:predicted transcriptional regulator